jgi:hypothetical protein
MILSYYVSLRSEVRIVMPVTFSELKRCSVRLYLQLFVGGRMLQVEMCKYLQTFLISNLLY